MKRVHVNWDTDGQVIEMLPTEVRIPSDIKDDEIADYLSDTFSYCVESFYEVPDKRKLCIGERVFNCDYFSQDLHGYGKILLINNKEVDAELDCDDEDSIILLEMEDSGSQNEVYANNVYQIAKDLTDKYGETICYEHNETNGEYPYYVPANDENYYGFELGV